ncbi:heat-shock protein Hsp20 [Candidatus Saccharibacteria bacterium]|nr:MAG: heat-shock protein Hsp20 [Candidatus Saccharibacteria bacterium]
MTQLVPFDPFADLQALQRSFFGDDWLVPSKRMVLATTDVYTEDDKNMVVEVHLPNFAEKDVDVHVDGNMLVISAEKHEEEKDKSKKYVVRESSSSFYRRIQLPKVADTEKIDGDMKNGVLKVVVPFKELPAPKKIAIKKK